MSASTFAVADLHGRLDLLEKALAAIARHAREGGTIVFLGDYIDRGPDSRRVIETLMAGPPPGWRWICLKGNHEALMVAAIDANSDPTLWLENGGVATLRAYGDPPRLDAVAPEHVAWCRDLPLSYADGKRIYVHAGVDPALPLAAQEEETLLWVRVPKWIDVRHPEGYIVHGHTPYEDGPIQLLGRTDLDTGAVFTGRLVVARFDDETPGGAVELLEIVDDGP